MTMGDIKRCPGIVVVEFPEHYARYRDGLQRDRHQRDPQAGCCQIYQRGRLLRFLDHVRLEAALCA